MMFFGLVSQAKPEPDAALSLDYREQSRIQVLLRRAMRRLWQHRKLALMLATGLCLSTYTQAKVLDPLLKLWQPYQTTLASVASEPVSDNDRTTERPQSHDESDFKNTDNINDEPSLYALLEAEFAADRSDIERGLSLYKQQAFKRDATAVFERALSLSLAYEAVDESLVFAKSWQDQNPDHVPAWFYVAHLALKAHDYALAGETLNRILRYDPRADLSEILIGIYPSTDEDRRELLAALQPIDSAQNASISVLKAGLLYQFDEPRAALIHIERALASQPDYVPYITLKADILRKIEPAQTVVNYVSQARLRNPDSKSLYLYEIRYLLDLKQSVSAWELLLAAHERFTEDPEITLLAALVSLDIQEYSSADQLLNTLAKSPTYLDQAYYYLGISAERQQRFEQAKSYLKSVIQEDLVLAARKKVVELELLADNSEAAIATLRNLREDFEVFAPDTFVLQADILWQQGKADEALELLSRASRKHPNSEAILFARVQLLDDRNDYVVKRTLLNHLQNLNPDNLSYQLSYAQLLLANDRNSTQGLELAQTIIQIRYDDPRYDNELHLQALNVLASNALANDNFTQVIDYLQTPYEVLPTLRSGVLLLRAYQGLENNEKVAELLADLQQRFAFGQQNVNDRIQLY
ncbi:tetratricopeptide repeat protein [uncultured Psychrobacter sp.]|jgi:predicted Zn-dependent protease|uniref:tetratricopeptide repeat protein n=1 Tax=uncultured Psychrobacter sp. TaxID=259303 RepID=UPI0026227F59|nr:tetratricopeptide repeat protein [uncultured Psychrobacter sp.]